MKCRLFIVLPWIPANELSFDRHFHLLLSHLKKDSSMEWRKSAETNMGKIRQTTGNKSALQSVLTNPKPQPNEMSW
jgi:hypothetical protein